VIRAGIDGRAFQSPAAGVRRYVWELARAFARLNQNSRGSRGGQSGDDSRSGVSVLGGERPPAPAGGVDPGRDGRAGSSGGELELVAIGAGPEDPLPESVRRYAEPASPPTNLGRHAVGLPLALRRAPIDLYHAPAYTAPTWGRVPIVLSLHDVSYARHPEWYPYHNDWRRRAFYRWSARRARVIVTISEFSRSEIVAAYGIDPGRVRVTYLGVDHAFAPAVTDGAAWLAGLRAAGGGRGAGVGAGAGTGAGAGLGAAAPYLLHVGDLHERRNLSLAVEAIALARRRHPMLGRVRLVLAGVDRGIGERLRREALALGEPDLVELAGLVSEERLLALYRGASLLIYPSRYEGFGFPVAEAMACGLPVLAARASALPEVVGEAGLLLDPDRVEDWSEAIAAVLSDDQRALAMRDAGLRRAARFSWDRTAEATLDVYRECVALRRD
jgi:glycosyltransferase involved in cell wall biosynthesis